jgi:hypothetical protein
LFGVVGRIVVAVMVDDLADTFDEIVHRPNLTRPASRRRGHHGSL